jgi:hypothetical protein
MKFSFFLISAFLSLFFVSSSWAALPKASLILQKTSENAGGGIYQIEQEVQFPNGQDVLVLKETWLIENENNMKLIVTGAKELKDQVSFSIQFTNGARNQGGRSSRLTEDFIERYFHFRSPEALAQTLAQLKLVPSNVMAKKPIKNIKDFEPTSESFVRLSRSGGVINYALGIPTPPEKETLNPGFWIEQDQFVIRKFRLPSQTEVSADRFSSYARGLMFPRMRTVRWGPNSVSIQTLSVAAKGKDTWATFGQKTPQKMEGLNSQPAAPLVDEFYKRFR